MSMCMHVCFPLGKTGDVRCRPPELHKFPRGSVRVARPWGFFGAKEQQIPVQKHAYAIRKAGMNAIQMQERLDHPNAGKKSSFHGQTEFEAKSLTALRAGVNPIYIPEAVA